MTKHLLVYNLMLCTYGAFGLQPLPLPCLPFPSLTLPSLPLSSLALPYLPLPYLPLSSLTLPYNKKQKKSLLIKQNVLTFLNLSTFTHTIMGSHSFSNIPHNHSANWPRIPQINPSNQNNWSPKVPGSHLALCCN